MTKYIKTFERQIVYSNKKFQKILDFYLFCCPVPGTSVRGKTFYDYGWSGSSDFGKLKKQMLEASAFETLKGRYFPCIKTDLEDRFNIVDSLEAPQEYCVFLKYDEQRVMQSLYSAIRNAFAHGSFNVGTYKKVRIYYFENFDGYMKAKIALHEETLLAWIDIITKNTSK